MTTVTQDFIAAEVALVEQLVDTPARAAWGRDLSCIFDCTEDLEEVPEDSEEAIVQSVSRRLITERGTLLDDLEYGFNIAGFLNLGMTTEDIIRLEAGVRGECLKDDRVGAVDVVVLIEGVTASITVTLTPLDFDLFPPSFTFTIDSTTNILELIA